MADRYANSFRRDLIRMRRRVEAGRRSGSSLTVAGVRSAG